MTTEAQLKAQARYDKENTKQITLKLNLKTDADILDWLAKQKNTQGYIKELVRADMRQHQTDEAMSRRLLDMVAEGTAKAFYQIDPYTDHSDLFIYTKDKTLRCWIKSRFGVTETDTMDGLCYVVPIGNGEDYQESLLPLVEAL